LIRSDGGAAPPPRRVLILAFVLIIGTGLRIGTLVLHPPLEIDEARYLITAHHLRHGIGYADWRGTEVDILPLHPFLTAAVSGSVDTLEWSGRAVTCIASILVLVALAFFTLRLGGIDLALLATSIAAVHPWLVRSAGRPVPESLYALLVLIALMSARGIMTGGPGPRRWGWSGFWFGLAYLTRPEGFIVAMLFGVLAAVAGSGTGRERARGLVRFTGILFIVSAPYLVWLHGSTGRWTLTGKSDEVFFIGQAIHAADGEPATADAYLSLHAQYGSALGYVRRHPIQVLERALRFEVRTLVWIVPRALGPLGLAGLSALLFMSLRAPVAVRAAMWPAFPAIMLGPIAFAVPEDRVAGSIIPFLLIPASYGLSDLSVRLRHRHWPLSVVTSIAVALLAAHWFPAVSRVVKAGRLRPVEIERQFARRALDLEPDVTRITDNSPVVSFYLRDPALFGPPGHYDPLPLLLECGPLADAMTQRGARGAVLDQWTGGRAMTGLGPECPLQVRETWVDTVTGRRMDLIALRPAHG